nr:NUDIX hydrolase [uncultured Rhodopila sp.]
MVQTPRFSLVDLAWRTGLRLGFPLARIWWRLRGRAHEGALVAVHVGPSVLLVRSSYRRAWNFPGGGVRPGESPEAAARRELNEEIGLTAPALLPAGVASGNWDGRADRVHFFQLRLDRLPGLRLDNREIVQARLMPPEAWPGLPVTGPVAAYLRTAGR